MRRSLFISLILTILTGLALPCAGYASGDDSPKEIEALLQTQYTGKILKLRNWYVEDEQTYAVDGKLEGKSEEGAWIRYGILAVDNVKLADGYIELHGQRILVVRDKFKKEDQLQWPDAGKMHPVLTRIKAYVTIRIKLAATQPSLPEVNAALQHVFVSRQELLPRIPSSLRPDYDRLMSGDWSHYERPMIDEAKRDGDEPFETTPEGLVLYRVSGPDRKTRVSAPEILSMVDPEYDKAARAARVEGIVVMQVIIDPQGNPRDVQLVSGLTPELETKAIAAVSKWKFRPAKRDGTPVATLSNIEVNFHLR